MENSKLQEKAKKLFDNESNLWLRSVAEGVMGAYSDCFDDLKGMPRDLSYFCRIGLCYEDAKKIATYCMPSGYNDYSYEAFERVAGHFQAGTYYFGREGSPVIYVKPSKSYVWFDEEFCNLADEVCYCPDLGLFRFWWD